MSLLGAIPNTVFLNSENFQSYIYCSTDTAYLIELMQGFGGGGGGEGVQREREEKSASPPMLEIEVTTV